MAATDEMLTIVANIRPDTVTLVPERPGEVTTEGGLGLDSAAVAREVEGAIGRLAASGIRPSLFVDPRVAHVEAGAAMGVRVVELNTAAWSEARGEEALQRELRRIDEAARRARALGIEVAAGHGLTAVNVGPIAKLRLVDEYNIGHFLVARAILVGMERAVREMKALL
jgi:pyridoxine 5-phosphate synthase